MDKSPINRSLYNMNTVTIIKTDDNVVTERIFTDRRQYESLIVGDIMEVECEDGIIRDFIVTEVEWAFGHFVNKYTVHIKTHSR